MATHKHDPSSEDPQLEARNKTAQDTQPLIALGAAICTPSEGRALAELQSRLPAARTLLASIDPASALQIHAALGPMWWMLGLAREGHAAASTALNTSSTADLLAVTDGAAPEGVKAGDPTLDLAPLLDPTATLEPRDPVQFLNVSDDLLRGCALDGAGMNAYATSAYGEAWRLHARAFAAAETTGGGGDAAVLRSRALDGLGRVARETGRYDLAWRLHVAAYEAALEARDAPTALAPAPMACAANAVSNAGVARARQGRPEEARALHRAALEARERIGDARGVASALGNLALLTPPGDALPLYRRSLAIREALGDVWGVAGSLRALAETHRKLGHAAEAQGHLARAAAIFAQVNDRLGVAECLETLGLLAFGADHGGALGEEGGADRLRVGDAEGQEAAATLLGAAVAVRRSIKADERVVTGHAEAALLKASCPEAWEAGEAMSMAEAAAFVAARLA